MANMRVELAGLALPNPILPGAGPLTATGVGAAAVAAVGAGGVVTRTVTPHPATGLTPHVEVRGGMLNVPRWSELPLEQWLAVEYPTARAAAQEAGIPLIAGIGYTAEDVAALVPQIERFVDAFELSSMLAAAGKVVDPWTDAEAARRVPADSPARNPAPLIAAIKTVKAASAKPLFVKVNPLGGGEMADLARQIEAAGADGIVATNALGPVMAIDLETGRPSLGTPDGYGWLAGTSLKPLALRCVFDIARAVKIPVIGSGGIGRPEDAIEFLMAGASAVQVTTAALKSGPRFYGQFAGRVEKWLDTHGYGAASDVIGLGISRWESLQPHRFTVPVLYDVSDCIGCRLCELSCHYDAIYMVPGQNKAGGGEIAEFNADRCFGCGLCVVRCPTDALLLPMLQWDGIYLHPKKRVPVKPGMGSIKDAS
ncbi:MAG TPA: 4Fe-4S dicluster domain-containing protein [Anaerolineae bacterium]